MGGTPKAICGSRLTKTLLAPAHFVIPELAELRIVRVGNIVKGNEPVRKPALDEVVLPESGVMICVDQDHIDVAEGLAPFQVAPLVVIAVEKRDFGMLLQKRGLVEITRAHEIEAESLLNED